MVPKLQRLVLAIARTVVHNDEFGGTAPNASVWSDNHMFLAIWVPLRLVPRLCLMLRM